MWPNNLVSFKDLLYEKLASLAGEEWREEQTGLWERRFLTARNFTFSIF